MIRTREGQQFSYNLNFKFVTSNAKIMGSIPKKCELVKMVALLLCTYYQVIGTYLFGDI